MNRLTKTIFAFTGLGMAFAGGLPAAHAFTILGSANSNLGGWNTTTLTFAVNPTSCGISQSALESLIDTAVAIWNTAPASKLKLARGGTTTSTAAQAFNSTAPDGPVIACSTAFAALTGTNADGTAGVGGFVTSGGSISNGGLVLNAESGKAASLALLSTAVAGAVIAHEMGHVIGLGHTGDTQALMYYNASAKTTVALSQDDMDGVAWLYPRQEFGSNFMGCGVITTAAAAGGSTWGGLTEILALFGICGAGARARRRKQA